MRNVRSSIGSASGSASFDVDAVRMRRGFNRAVSIIAYGEVKPMARNGSMFRQIRFVPAWSSTPRTIGHIKAFWMSWLGKSPGQLDGVSPYHIAIWFSESLANHNSVSHRVDRRWRSLALPEFPTQCNERAIHQFATLKVVLSKVSLNAMMPAVV